MSAWSQHLAQHSSSTGPAVTEMGALSSFSAHCENRQAWVRGGKDLECALRAGEAPIPVLEAGLDSLPSRQLQGWEPGKVIEANFNFLKKNL